MKTEEDEAFDELAKKQGMWGGGFPAKRAMAADKLQEPPSEWAGIKTILDEYGLQAIDFVADFKAALAQPAQDYAAKNPLGGPAKIFDAMAACIRAGDSFDSVLRQYGFAEAQPAQEPVACERCKQLEGQAYDLLGQLKVANLKWSVAHPWVGLTDEETQASWDWEDWQTGAGRSTIFEMVRDIEAKLKEKNG